MAHTTTTGKPDKVQDDLELE